MKAYRIVVIGIVQGVGFRPFIHRIAIKSNVKGYVRNVGGSEVEIHIEGENEELSKFMELLFKELPPPAKIEEITIDEVPVKGYTSFKILPSAREVKKYSMIPPDIAICNECLKEVLDPKDRRYRYPFNACAWCGPRYSIMYTIPYDRENTSMKHFPLCNDCLMEYTDLNNIRRYHAQGICCPKCGPKVWLTDKQGNIIECKDPIKLAAKLIDEGCIVAVKGIGGYHIACLASDDEIVLTLRRRKKRPYKPFAIMALNLDIAEKLVYIDEKASRILTSPERPIILLPKKENTPVSEYVSPGLDREGIFLPYTALHYLLLMETHDKFLIMTSGNAHGKPMCIDEECAYSKLKNIVDYYLVHDRIIVNRVDDSVLRFTDGEPVLLRRGRGYAPTWIRLKFKLKKPVIAFGAELQTTGAVAFDDKVVLTQFIGDVDDPDVLEDLDKYLKFLLRTYNINPCECFIVCDKHPHYLSKMLAQEYASQCSSNIIEVQHHYAHTLSALADMGSNVDDRIVAIAIDSVGYGDDGMIWGGEVLLIGYNGYERVGHLKYQPLVGGDLTIRYPTRMLISLMSTFMDYEEIVEYAKKLKLLRGLRRGPLELEVIIRESKRPRVLTSSIARILDSISALLGVCYERTYEGEPAIKLEAFSRNGKLIDEINIPLIHVDGKIIADTTHLIETILTVLDKYEYRDIAYTIQYALGRALGEIALKHINKSTKNIVVVSGGAAVNTIIVKGIKSALNREGIKVYLPKRVPPNDGGIALGQVAAMYKHQVENNV